MDAEPIKNRFQSQLRECREALETKEKELKRLREHLLDVEEAEDRDEMSIEERVEEEKRRVEEKFEKEVERLSMQLMEKEDGLNRKIKEVENLNRALGSFYADQEQMDGRTNEASGATGATLGAAGILRHFKCATCGREYEAVEAVTVEVWKGCSAHNAAQHSVARPEPWSRRA